jgi:DNA-binding transcriptional LysR family regulator
VLTEVGHAFYDSVNGSISAIDEADELARERTVAPTGVVRIAAAPDLSARRAALRPAQAALPGDSASSSPSRRASVDVAGEGFDLAIRAGRLDDSSLIVRRLGPTSAALVASPAYLRARGPTHRRGRPAGARLGAAQGDRGSSDAQAHQRARRETVEVSTSLVADDLGFCRRAAEAGAGSRCCPRSPSSSRSRRAAWSRCCPAGR